MVGAQQPQEDDDLGPGSLLFANIMRKPKEVHTTGLSGSSACQLR